MQRKILKSGTFGPIIGLLIIGIFLLLKYFTVIPERLELKILDVHFRSKDPARSERVQEGVTFQEQNIRVSPDLVLLAVDNNSLLQFGQWPWPRWRHADLVNSLARISDQTNRERALWLDLFFNEPSDAYSDAVLIDAIASSGRVFLETVLTNEPAPAAAEEEFFQRHETLFDNDGRISYVDGPWWEMRTYFGIDPPLQPYGRATSGYGHANFDPDFDGVFRRAPIIAKVSQLVDQIRLDELTVDTPVDFSNYERLAWIDRDGRHHHIEYPLTEAVLSSLARDMENSAPQAAVDTDSDGEPDDYFYVVRKYRDQFLPSITLSLALSYFNKDFDDLEVVIGEYVRIPNPQYFDTETDEWGPYYVTEAFPVYDEEGQITEPGEYRLVEDITIPIDEDGEMLINYAGSRSSASRDGYQTYPVRSVATYASRVPGPDPYTWRPTLALDNKLVMVGGFSAGMAEDEKTTPYGLMYGVEMHTNTLNTIIMDNFLIYAPDWLDALILAGLVLITALLVGRLKNPIWSLAIVLVALAGYFLAVNLIFYTESYILNYGSVAIAALLTYLSVLGYRALTEGRERARMRAAFSQSVSPAVMEWMLDMQDRGELELGGDDKEITVFFSDIRGFTSMSEGMEPQELLNHLNEYLSAMSEVVTQYNGTLDKYVGDEIMAFWGAPKPQREHAILACKCALKQREVLAELNAGWPEHKRIRIGIGINTGIMTAGLMGSRMKSEYSLTGDNVNLGARLEGINKEYGTMIIVSESTYQLVKDHVIARELDRVMAKGKQKAVTIYELWEMKGPLEPTPEELANE